MTDPNLGLGTLVVHRGEQPMFIVKKVCCSHPCLVSPSLVNSIQDQLWYRNHMLSKESFYPSECGTDPLLVLRVDFGLPFQSL